MNLPDLSRSALDELKYMFQHYSNGTVKTETPPFRGDTPELSDAGLIEYMSDDGLWTTYRLTALGEQFRASM